MAIKTTVAEWLAYVETPWPEGWVIEEENVHFGNAEEPDPENDFFVDHLRTLDPAMEVRIECGTITNENDRGFEPRDLLSHFRAWKKARGISMVVTEVPRDREAEFVALLEANGFKVPKAVKKAADAMATAPADEAPAAPRMGR